REYLSKYDRLDIDSEVKMQKSFDEMKSIVKEYPITNDEPEKNNTYLSYNAVITTALDEKLYAAFQVIDYALIVSPGAALKKALLDSGICKDVDSLFENGVLQPYFSIVIRNSDIEKRDEFHSIIRKVIEDVVKNGYDKKALSAAINIMEFKYREADYGHYPKGLMYGLCALDSWLYDENEPFMHIRALDTFEFLKKMVDTDYFEKLTEKYFLENTHVSSVSLVPVKGLTVKKDGELEKKLADIKAGMSKEEIDELIEDTKALHKYQEEPDTEEVLKCIPLLEISDIKKEAEGFINEKFSIGGRDVLFHDIFTNGIGYLYISFNLDRIPDELIGYLGFLKSFIGLVDTENYSYTDLANEIFLNSGGITSGSGMYADVDDYEKFTCCFEMKAKVLYSQLPFAFSMIKEIIYTSDFSDKKRLYELICMLKARMQSSMMSGGHTVALQRASAGISKSDMITERTGGISFLRLVEEIEGDFENRADELIEKLNEVAHLIFTKENIILVDYTAEKKEYQSFAGLAAEFIDGAPSRENPIADIAFTRKRGSEAFRTSAKVQYVAKCGTYKSPSLPYTGALKVMKVIMGYDYLWNQVRVVGGAYGCFSAFSRNGKCSFTSYRDPNLKRTLDVYEKAVDYLKNFKAGKRDMTKYIIGTVADLDFPLTPSAKGSRSRGAWLCNDTVEKLQKERDEILSCTEESIRSLAAYVEKMKESECICVVGSEEEIDKEKDLFTNIEALFSN
ncbi:MAG: insulinase family protein, partial [Lachnospiraceae bacterium]|nr:insulinase family protein [Lachnospiraceae bacterium]